MTRLSSKWVRVMLLVSLTAVATFIWSLHFICELHAEGNIHLRTVLLIDAEKYYTEFERYPETIENLLSWHKQRHPNSGCSTENPWGYRYLWHTSCDGQEVYFFDAGRDGEVSESPTSWRVVCGERQQFELLDGDLDRDFEVVLVGCESIESLRKRVSDR
jgi:hypothetical protein